MIGVPRSATASRATRLALTLAALLGGRAGAQVCTTEVSRFDAGPEGWTWTSGVGWTAAGGNPGGFLQFVDRGPNFNGWVVAPAAYRGDQAQLWYRDPLATSNRDSSLSNAIEFCVGP